MKFPQLRQFCFLPLSHILGMHVVFLQVLCSPFLKTLFSLKNIKVTKTTAPKTNQLTHSVRSVNPEVKLIFSGYNILSLLPCRKTEESKQSNKGSFNVLILSNGL